MNNFARNAVLAAIAATALVFASAVPAMAGGGYRTCPAPKSVAISSVTQGNGGNHAYAASGQVYYIPVHDPNVAYPYQTYGAPIATYWSVNYGGPIPYENAGCA